MRASGGRLQVVLCANFGREAGIEAAADALAYGWEHWSRVSQMANPAGYLYSVGRDRARRSLSGRRMDPVGSLDSVAAAVAGSPWVEPGLQGALAGLSERQRVSVLLVHGAEWQLSEVADFLGISRGSVKRHLDRGMAKLRAVLEVEL